MFLLLQGKLTGMLALSVFVSVIGCSFQFGFQNGVLNTPQKVKLLEILSLAESYCVILYKIN